MEKDREIKQKSAVELAFMGDAVYELLVREHITRSIDTKPNTLHRMCVDYVCADAQCAALELLLPELSPEELDIVRRGKNATKTSVPRNGSPRSYRSSTALEALFGYLYLCGETQRARLLFSHITQQRDSMQPTQG
ncbi:MAG: ribonuclease III domain-containing protein [Oscillospiraceae bacterium]|nr:ribonuclease III domain-containing protein [Oscillospiraceae bacterium]